VIGKVGFVLMSAAKESNMRTGSKLFTVFTLVLMTISQHINASAADLEKFKTSSAEAFFSSVDPSGCIETLVWVFAADPSASAGLILRQYDVCNGIFLRDAYGSAELAEPDFKVDVGNLASASLKATINVYDYDYISISSFDVFVDLVWTGTGSLSRYIDNSQWHDRTCHEISHHNGVTRSAEASGTVSDRQTNFTPAPSMEARLYLDKYVDITGCKVLMLAPISQ
jgi:hypothetical protein